MIREADLLLVARQQVLQGDVGLRAVRTLEVGELDHQLKQIINTIDIATDDILETGSKIFVLVPVSK